MPDAAPPLPTAAAGEPEPAADVLDAFLALPRVGGLALSPDGRRLVVGVATLAEDGTRHVGALWELDPGGRAAPRRLTRSGKGEQAPAFAADGTLLFLSARPSGAADEPDVARLWALPPGSGEAVLLAAPAAGVAGAAAARRSPTVLIRTALHPDADSLEADARLEKARAEAEVTAQLVAHYPARFWDRWLGPRQAHLLAGTAQEGTGWRDLTPEPGFRYEEQAADVSADGRTVLVSRWRDEPDPRDRGVDLVALTLDEEGEVTGERTVLGAHRTSHTSPAIDPEGRRAACVRGGIGTPDGPPDRTIVVVDLDTGAAVDVLEGFDRWPDAPHWLPGGDALLFTADDDGRRLPFRVDLADGTVTRLAAEGAWSDLAVAPDGTTLYAVRSDVDAPPHVVALDLTTADPAPRVLHAPAAGGLDLGRVERVETTAADGTRVPGWLVLPTDGGAAAPAPLAVLIHGGPLASWTGWHWRWSPHVLAACGYAVLCPDPALSTGYGLDAIRRGWGRWGAEPYTDILALTDEVERRPDVDAERTAALGGSFGGYMANWVAGHTDRFDAIVTHASLWNLEAFHGTTDLGPWWENEFGDRYEQPERYREWSPHRFVADITTPMLVIHGERDFRVPVSEGISLWTDLRRHGVEGVYLHFPDEHHWVLKPQHTRLWYATVLAFLDHHVRGAAWRPPALLGGGS